MNENVYGRLGASWGAGYEAAREQAAALLDLSASDLLLVAGEMTPQELRAVQAILKNRREAILAMRDE